MNRRKFLQGAGHVVAGVGVLDTIFALLEAPTAQAQPSPQKLALLVGINQYQNRARFPDLRGCLSDVDLMQHLLIYRFGFQPQNIIVLRNEDATRHGIELLFQNHLIERAQASDVVVFHFSGFGRYLLPQSEPSGTQAVYQSPAQYALMPYDACPEAEASAGPPQINAILQETLYLLLQSLRTDRVFTLLDTGFHYPGSPRLEHSRIRALPAGLLREVTPEAWAVQTSLMSRNKLKRSQLTEKRLSTPARGVVVTAASLQQFGIEADWSGFSAGALTYNLTQELWHTAPNAGLATQVSRASEALAEEFSLTQQPELGGQKKVALTRDLLGLPGGPAGDGIVLRTEMKGRHGDCWLGGISPSLLKTDHACFVFSTMPHSAETTGSALMRLNSRKGLWGTVHVLQGEALIPDQQFKEKFRILDRSQPLRLALSSRLDHVEQVDATSVFSGLGSAIKVVKADQSADVVLTKLERLIKDPPAADSEGTAERSLQICYCLCTVAGDVLPATVSDKPEAIKNRPEAFQDTFSVLAWNQCLEQLVNPHASEVMAGVSLMTQNEAGNSVSLLAKSTVAKGLNLAPALGSEGQILTPRATTRFQIQLQNYDRVPLYTYVFGFDAQPNAILVLSSVPPTDNPSEHLGFTPFKVEANQSLTLPTPEDLFSFYGPAGISSFYILFTKQRLPLTDRALDGATKTVNKSAQPKQVKLADPAQLRDALLTDLDTLSRPSAQVAGLMDESAWQLAMDQWGMLKFVYQLLG
ncbi:caspase family protein [Lyngbya confervoides]|uniref:Caspase family protein n=1 Tax=Lyngbya confervoides BDU141951 TaxID=1574623 RepID=A0ABD4T269_9CYAN|nr:caspase family protein [Lyngbya confervoides]MCM1982685.1 caspase family protein [Lyngbya confervoides BDU141951]